MIPTILLTIAGSILISKIKESKKLIRNVCIISSISLISIFIISILPKRIKNIVEYDASYAEYLPVEIDREYIKNRGKTITSNNEVETNFKKIGTTMDINFKQNEKETYLELPLIYYKGYEANKGKLEIFKTENGLLGVKINDIKEGKINVEYKGTTLMKITKIISLLSALVFVPYTIKEVKHEK